MPRKTHPERIHKVSKLAKRRRTRKNRARRPELTPREIAAKKAAAKKRQRDRRKARRDLDYAPRPLQIEHDAADGTRSETDETVPENGGKIET